MGRSDFERGSSGGEEEQFLNQRLKNRNGIDSNHVHQGLGHVGNVAKTGYKISVGILAGSRVRFGQGRVPTGQLHHPISTKVGRAIQNHPNLKGAFAKRDPRFVTRAVDGNAHRGYQRWHRDLDDEVVEWIENNPNSTPDDFMSYLRGLYNRPDLCKRFPNGF